MEKKRNKIIWADDQINLYAIRNMLRAFHEVYPAPSAAKLFEILENVIPDLILIDINTPEVNGYETMKKLKADNRFSEIPVLFIATADAIDSEMEGFDLGVADYIFKPFSGPLLLKRIENHILAAQQRKDLSASQSVIKYYTDTLDKNMRQKTAEALDLQNAVISSILNLVERGNSRDHISRTRLFLEEMVGLMLKKELYIDKIADWDMDCFLASSLLHDIGKIAIADRILNKPSELNSEEFGIMKTHVRAGEDAIKKMMGDMEDSVFLRHALFMTGTHHEKWDGTGYPAGLKGEDIPLEGRLMAIADVYGALVSDRPYRKALSHGEAAKIIAEGSGTYFDPALTEVFLGASEDFERISVA